MIDVLLSFSGYAWGMLHDLAALRAVPRVKPYLLALSATGHLLALYRLMRSSSRFEPPRALRRASMVVAPLGWAAMVYSVMVEIPFRKGWIDQGHTDELVTTGTYSLTRHPGVLWFSIAVFASAIATRSKRLLFAAPVIIAGDVVHVKFQEEAVLSNVFGETYREYQRTTPFVVPNVRSAVRFLRTLARPGQRA